MPHPFSNALYYPYIDIRDSDWLKTAALFWDSISTIVPESMAVPYRTHDTERLADAGFLRPLRVNSASQAVVQMEDDLASILSSPEIIQSCFFPKNRACQGVYAEKLSYSVRNKIQEAHRSLMYPEKFSWMVRKEVEDGFDSPYGPYNVDPAFASIYMLALANRLSEENSLAMITDEIPSFSAGDTIRLGNQSNMFAERHSSVHNRYLAQGVLLNCVIESISISRENTIEQILSFKNRHRDELGRFKTEIAELTKEYDDEHKPISILQREIEDLYWNRFRPSYADLKSALSSFGIKWFSNSFIKVSTISASATGVPMALLGMPVETALYAAAGLSVIASATSYVAEKRELLRKNPYSYLLSVNNSSITRQYR